MGDKPGPRFAITVDARKLFFPGQKILLKPSGDHPEVSFTIRKLSTPVTKSVVVLATTDAGDPEQVVVKIYDPRYLDERISVRPRRQSYPWNLATEQAAVVARPENSRLSEEELTRKVRSYGLENPTPDDLAARCLFQEECYYRVMMDAYEAEFAAYERLKDFQGSAIPRLIMSGQLLPLDERAIQIPAIVLEYVPSVNLFDVPFDAITPAIRTQLLSAIETFPSRGVIHNDFTVTNICFTPPEQPVRGIVLDFGYAVIQSKYLGEKEEWETFGASETWWARRLLEDKSVRDSLVGKEYVSRFI